jgi:hypothetical protein
MYEFVASTRLYYAYVSSAQLMKQDDPIQFSNHDTYFRRKWCQEFVSAFLAPKYYPTDLKNEFQVHSTHKEWINAEIWTSFVQDQCRTEKLQNSSTCTFLRRKVSFRGCAQAAERSSKSPPHVPRALTLSSWYSLHSPARSVHTGFLIGGIGRRWEIIQQDAEVGKPSTFHGLSFSGFSRAATFSHWVGTACCDTLNFGVPASSARDPRFWSRFEDQLSGLRLPEHFSVPWCKYFELKFLPHTYSNLSF